MLNRGMCNQRIGVTIIAMGAVLIGAASGYAFQNTGKKAPPVSGEQQVFDTPQAAVDALFTAIEADDKAAAVALFGPDYKQLVTIEDPAERADAMRELVQAYEQKNFLDKQPDGSMVLVIGTKEWPFPVPLAKTGKGWRFDTAAGIEEIANRRVGENEIEAIANCRAYISAQRQYAARDRDGDEVREYAQKIRSDKGKQDGLYWHVDPNSGAELSPFGEFLAEAARRAERGQKAPAPYHGYYYRILTRQGGNAPGGEYDYIINGNMIAGFAIVAWPAEHGKTGIMTFVASHHGKVYEKDLGEKTSDIAKAMTAYNPDKTWTQVEPE
jgi:hypothetical protein